MAGIANVKGCDCCKASWLASHDHADMNRASQAMQLFKEAQKLLSYLIDTANDSIKATYGLWEACSQDDDIMISTPRWQKNLHPYSAPATSRQRRQLHFVSFRLHRSGRFRNKRFHRDICCIDRHPNRAHNRISQGKRRRI